MNFVCFLKVRELITFSEFCLTDLFLRETIGKIVALLPTVFLLLFISGYLVLNGGTGFRNGLCDCVKIGLKLVNDLWEGCLTL